MEEDLPNPERLVHRVRFRILLISLFMITILSVGLSIPVKTIDGVWTSPAFTNCMCDSYDFWELKGGVITSFSDRHESGIPVGRYTKKASGIFTVLLRDDDPLLSVQFDVQPRAMHWLPPEESLNGMPHPTWMRGFYRPLFPARAETIIANTNARVGFKK